jgi:hypothetical protein
MSRSIRIEVFRQVGSNPASIAFFRPTVFVDAVSAKTRRYAWHCTMALRSTQAYVGEMR